MTGLSQAEFAKSMGISRATVGNAEAGHEVRKLTLHAWALRAGVDLNWLRDGENPREQVPGGGSTFLAIEGGTPSGTRTPNPLVKGNRAQERPVTRHLRVVSVAS